MKFRTFPAAAIAAAVSLFATNAATGAGSGLNVLVVANASSSNSLALANYFCEQRQVPPQNVLRINWTGSVIEWGLTNQYQPTLLSPLLAAISERGLTNQIEYVVLSMDIPYRLNGGVDGANSTTTALFYGFKKDSRDPFTCPLATNSLSAYAGAEGPFRQNPPAAPGDPSFLATMITASNLALAKKIVDSGVASDATFPTQPVLLTKTPDIIRSVRWQQFDNAVFNDRLLGFNRIARTNVNNGFNLGTLAGLQTGLFSYPLSGTTFVPGSMADSLTSWGGALFENTGQSPLLVMLHAGAAGSYGTVMEPCAYVEKFPIAQNYFFQDRGFSLAESYYMSVTNPYEGIIVGEPLAAPFALPCSGDWNNLPQASLLSGTTNLAVQFTAADSTRPVQQVDLFIDGQFFQTLTNVAPAPGNVISITLPGDTNMTYTVAPFDNIATVAQGVAGVLNANSNVTKITAITHGDRIELQSTVTNRAGSEIFISVSNNIGSATALNTFARASQSNFLDTIAWGYRSFHIGVGVVTNDVITLDVTKTNGVTVSVSITNFVPSTTLLQFVQQFANAINSTPALQSDDGVIAEDVVTESQTSVEMILRARSIGWSAAQIQAHVFGDFNVNPAATRRLDENIRDLRPRNNLYITAGVSNLAHTFALDTTMLADGWHELTAVAYEGSHVRTQRRISQTARVQNTPLSATLNHLGAGTNAPLGSTLAFDVTANTNNISSIELFTTGGSWGVVSNQSSTTFSIPATNLFLGLHPFYAIVTGSNGKQFRTATIQIRIVDTFPLAITSPPTTLSWLADTSRLYQIWSTTNITTPFTLRDVLSPSNANAFWLETNVAPQQFYRVQSP